MDLTIGSVNSSRFARLESIIVTQDGRVEMKILDSWNPCLAPVMRTFEELRQAGQSTLTQAGFYLYSETLLGDGEESVIPAKVLWFAEGILRLALQVGVERIQAEIQKKEVRDENSGSQEP